MLRVRKKLQERACDTLARKRDEEQAQRRDKSCDVRALVARVDELEEKLRIVDAKAEAIVMATGEKFESVDDYLGVLCAETGIVIESSDEAKVVYSVQTTEQSLDKPKASKNGKKKTKK